MTNLKVTALGQTGFLFDLEGFRIIVDPYLSDHVADLYGSHLKRLIISKFKPEDLRNIAAVFITHAHADHCDPITLKGILKSNPNCSIYGSHDCRQVLEEYGVSTRGFKVSDSGPLKLASNRININVIPSAHIEIDINSDGYSRYLGYVFKVGNVVLYHAGDTIPHESITEKLRTFGKLTWAFLPVNERNYFRDKAGIVGNMSPKEALQWAQNIGVQNLVPTHWDTFAPNTTFPEEIDLIQQRVGYNLKVQWIPIDTDLIIPIQTE